MKEFRVSAARTSLRTIAVSWYRKAAEQGVAVAQFQLGLKYDLGEGVPEDDVMAVSWYRKAAEQGNADAQKALAALQRIEQEQRLAREAAEREANIRRSNSEWLLALSVIDKMPKGSDYWILKVAKGVSENFEIGDTVGQPDDKGGLQAKGRAAYIDYTNRIIILDRVEGIYLPDDDVLAATSESRARIGR